MAKLDDRPKQDPANPQGERQSGPEQNPRKNESPGLIRAGMGEGDSLRSEQLEQGRKVEEKETSEAKPRQIAPAQGLTRSAREVYELLIQLSMGQARGSAQVEQDAIREAERIALTATDTDEVLGALRFLQGKSPERALAIALQRIREVNAPGFEPHRILVMVNQDMDNSPNHELSESLLRQLDPRLAAQLRKVIEDGETERS